MILYGRNVIIARQHATGCAPLPLEEKVMAVGGPGADSSVLLTRLIGGKPMIDVAAELFGQMPVLWGRYFTSVATTGLVEYCGRRAACLTLVVAPDDRRLLNGSAVGDR